MKWDRTLHNFNLVSEAIKTLEKKNWMECSFLSNLLFGYDPKYLEEEFKEIKVEEQLIHPVMFDFDDLS